MSTTTRRCSSTHERSVFHSLPEPSHSVVEPTVLYKLTKQLHSGLRAELVGCGHVDIIHHDDALHMHQSCITQTSEPSELHDM